jgi:hypothetical protein
MKWFVNYWDMLTRRPSGITPKSTWNTFAVMQLRFRLPPAYLLIYFRGGIGHDRVSKHFERGTSKFSYHRKKERIFAQFKKIKEYFPRVLYLNRD